MGSVAVLIPVYNGAVSLAQTLKAVDALQWHEALRVIVVDDGSTDRSRAIAEQWEGRHSVIVVDGAGIGAAAALNRGLLEVDEQFVAQIDQDVSPRPDWLNLLVGRIQQENAAAVQGHFVADPRDGLLARAAQEDLDQRYREMAVADHVCTGVTVYRTAWLRQIGGFDEAMGYGYDNDVSYRIVAQEGRLLHEPRAKAVHRFPCTLAAYLRKQYGVAYGRLDLIRKHPSRAGGDSVSGTAMILHGFAGALCLALLFGASLVVFTAGAALAVVFMVLALMLLTIVVCERLVAALRAWRSRRSPVVFLWPILHVLRDLAWGWAVFRWWLRMLNRRKARASHSMAR